MQWLMAVQWRQHIMQQIAKKKAQLTSKLDFRILWCGLINATCTHIFISFLLPFLEHPLSHSPASAHSSWCHLMACVFGSFWWALTDSVSLDFSDKLTEVDYLFDKLCRCEMCTNQRRYRWRSLKWERKWQFYEGNWPKQKPTHLNQLSCISTH